tara:strand:+ start:170 stop:1486 length:1317 start_codon:yes stop_codon:yes gene_type:complete
MVLKITKNRSGGDGLGSRRAAMELLSGVLREDNSLEEAAEGCRSFLDLSPRDKAFAWLLTLSCLRHLGEIDALISMCLKKPLPRKAHRVNDSLRLGLTQILFVGTPDYAAVNSTVDLADGGMRGFRKLINAVLRRVLREGQAWLEGLDGAYLNTPKWLWHSWEKEYGLKTTRNIAEIHCKEPPLDISLKEAKIDSGVLEGKRLLGSSIRVNVQGPVSEMVGFQDGFWWVQDLAATLPVKMLGQVGGEEVIDLCAAPGGKTAQLCDAGAKVFSVDVSSRRLEILKENLDRLSFSSKIVCADIRGWRPKHPVDFVLLDAPCTGTGTIRRHPDILHRRTLDQVVRSAKLLDQLLVSAAEMTKVGGTLVFSTCSLQSQEGPDCVDSFLASNPGFVRDPLGKNFGAEIGAYTTESGYLRTLPCCLGDYGGMDGFFAARLKRAF